MIVSTFHKCAQQEEIANFADGTLERITCFAIKLNVLTLHGIVSLVVQTRALVAAQEVHIHLFTFSVYFLHSSGRQRYYFSVEDPRKAATL